MPASGAPRRDMGGAEARRRSLADRIAQPRTQPTAPSAARAAAMAQREAADASPRKEQDPVRVTGFLRALDKTSVPAPAPAEGSSSGMVDGGGHAVARDGNIAAHAEPAEAEIHTAAAGLAVPSPEGGVEPLLPADEPAPAVPSRPAPGPEPVLATEPPPGGAQALPAKARRPGLLERLTGIDSKAAAGS
jgi:hypothetical protein